MSKNSFQPQPNSKGEFRQLDEMVKSMIEPSEIWIKHGTSKTSSRYMVLATMCKVCEKEGHIMDIKRHIESIHLEGISVPCIQCSQAFKSRDALPCFKTSQTELMQ